VLPLWYCSQSSQGLNHMYLRMAIFNNYLNKSWFESETARWTDVLQLTVWSYLYYFYLCFGDKMSIKLKKIWVDSWIERKDNVSHKSWQWCVAALTYLGAIYSYNPCVEFTLLYGMIISALLKSSSCTKIFDGDIKTALAKEKKRIIMIIKKEKSFCEGIQKYCEGAQT